MSRADEHDGPPVEPGLLHAYLDGELPADEARRVEAQIAASAAAQRQLEAARLERALADDLLAMVELDPPVQVPDVTTVLDRGTDAERAAASLAADVPTRAHDASESERDAAARPVLHVERGGAGAGSGTESSRIVPLAWPPRGAWRWAAAVLLMAGGTWLLTPRSQREVPGAVLGEAGTPTTSAPTPMQAPAAAAADAKSLSDTPVAPSARAERATEPMADAAATRQAPATTDLRSADRPLAQSKTTAAESRAERGVAAEAAPIAAAPPERAENVVAPAAPPPPPMASPPSSAPAPRATLLEAQRATAERATAERAARGPALPRRITLEDARALLGHDVSQLAGVTPSRVELLAENPALVRLVYVDATGAEIILDQEPASAAPRVGDADAFGGRARRAATPIRWTVDGLRLQLDGTVSQDSLARIRARLP